MDRRHRPVHQHPLPDTRVIDATILNVLSMLDVAQHRIYEKNAWLTQTGLCNPGLVIVRMTYEAARKARGWDSCADNCFTVTGSILLYGRSKQVTR